MFLNWKSVLCRTPRGSIDVLGLVIFFLFDTNFEGETLILRNIDLT